jgi:hypothetical protein
MLPNERVDLALDFFSRQTLLTLLSFLVTGYFGTIQAMFVSKVAHSYEPMCVECEMT